MKTTKKNCLFTFLVLATLTLGMNRASAEVEIAYPDTVNTLFTIEVPNNWKLTPMDPTSKFFLIEGPRGVKMWFRAMPVSSETELKAAVEAAKESGREWLSASYSDIILEDGTFGEREGMSFVSIAGVAKTNANGEKVKLSAALATMENGAMAQLWTIIPESAAQGEEYAKKVVKSFTPR